MTKAAVWTKAQSLVLFIPPTRRNPTSCILFLRENGLRWWSEVWVHVTKRLVMLWSRGKTMRSTDGALPVIWITESWKSQNGRNFHSEEVFEIFCLDERVRISSLSKSYWLTRTINNSASFASSTGKGNPLRKFGFYWCHQFSVSRTVWLAFLMIFLTNLHALPRKIAEYVQWFFAIFPMMGSTRSDHVSQVACVCSTKNLWSQHLWGFDLAGLWGKDGGWQCFPWWLLLWLNYSQKLDHQMRSSWVLKFSFLRQGFVWCFSSIGWLKLSFLCNCERVYTRRRVHANSLLIWGAQWGYNLLMRGLRQYWLHFWCNTVEPKKTGTLT